MVGSWSVLGTDDRKCFEGGCCVLPHVSCHRGVLVAPLSDINNDSEGLALLCHPKDCHPQKPRDDNSSIPVAPPLSCSASAGSEVKGAAFS